ncbi:hypothetical protein TrVE_jg9254 [Triparma verrucosa]|uniref:Uncharacterized protein n=1 Tax=Triparma verrucosa TaxID=1606542 RepID=A0A9W7EV83_9STRA|nr:hypothetical protein TrVE_jg9254 [Triparma verrucosa]
MSANDNDSDVEIEGMEIDDIDSEEEQLTTSQSVSPVPPSGIVGGDVKEEESAEVKAAREKARKEEEVMQEAARREKEAMLARAGAKDLPEKADAQSRLNYLMTQSEVFSHFLAGSSTTGGDADKSKKKGKGGRTRMTEEAEDAALLATAQSKRRVIRVDKQPALLVPTCKMHPYQLEGLNWMIKLHDNGINGILADEMGLGKTLQTISLLAYLREARGIKGQHLVVVPKSVTGNWIREIKKWCPSIRAVKLPGTRDERLRVTRDVLPKNQKTGEYDWDVCVTSYEGMLKEKSVLGKMKWEYLIIDEAHRIKNENSSLSRVVRTMKTTHRLLITGTPLQNNLHELWALLNFLLPDVFGSADVFDSWFSLDAEGEGADEKKDNVIKKLHTVLRPFMLRRVKKDVAHALPPKKETKLFIGLTDMQMEYYKKILKKEAVELNSLGGSTNVRLLNTLMQLRKVCNHPYLFQGAEPGPPYSDGPHLWENTGKMQLLHKLLIKLKANGSRVLIFSQMTRMLDILEDYMRYVKYDYCRIDGSTGGEQRDEQMDEFNAEDSKKFTFLLSTRAGGLGINLATADIVILFDSDWNPQVDLQAMDRAHRIGQKKPVQVFRFVTEGSVEEKITECADRKLFLDAAVIQQGRLADQNNKLGKDDLMKLVTFGADQILAKKGSSYTDEDIDLLLEKSEKRTEDMNAALQKNVQHNLASFSIMGDDEAGSSIYAFGGEDFKNKGGKAGGMMIDLGQRERKGRNYEGDGGAGGGFKADVKMGKKRSLNMLDHQFYNKEAMAWFFDREDQLETARQQVQVQVTAIRDQAKLAPSLHNMRANLELEPGKSSEELFEKAQKIEDEMLSNPELRLSDEERAEKKALIDEAYADWSKGDFKTFTKALEMHGRYNLEQIQQDVANETGKSIKEVQKYYCSFLRRYREIAGYQKLIDRFDRAEAKREAREKRQVAISWKLEGVEDWKGGPPLLGTRHGNSYSAEEDSFLLFSVGRYGYGAWPKIRIAIRQHWQFRFNYFFKSRTEKDIQNRVDYLLKLVEKEYEEALVKEIKNSGSSSIKTEEDEGEGEEEKKKKAKMALA